MFECKLLNPSNAKIFSFFKVAITTTFMKIKDFLCNTKVPKGSNSISKSTRSHQDLSGRNLSYLKRNKTVLAASARAPAPSSYSMGSNGPNWTGNNGQQAVSRPGRAGQQSTQQGIVLHCDLSQTVCCPQCNVVVHTTTIFVPGTCTYLLCLLPIP